MAIYLHADPRSPVASRVILFVALAKLPVELKHVQLVKGEQLKPEFLAMNPFHHVPVLEDKDNNIVIYNSNAILTYLAKKFAPQWVSDDVVEATRIVQYNDTIIDEFKNMNACYFAKFILNKKSDKYDAFAEAALKLFKVYDQELAGKEWFVGNRPTLVEPIVYIHYELTTAIGVDLSAFPTIQAWARRVEALPGFKKML